MNIDSKINTGFQARISPQLPPKRVRFRVPGKNNTVVISTIYADKSHHIKILDYQVRHRNNILDSGSFKNKKGFNDDNLSNICQEIQEKVKDGVDYLAEFFNVLFINKL